MYVEVTVKFNIENLGTSEDFDNAARDWSFMSREELVEWLIQEEGLFGIANEKYEIVRIEMKEERVCDEVQYQNRFQLP